VEEMVFQILFFFFFIVLGYIWILRKIYYSTLLLRQIFTCFDDCTQNRLYCNSIFYGTLYDKLLNFYFKLYLLAPPITNIWLRHCIIGSKCLINHRRLPFQPYFKSRKENFPNIIKRFHIFQIKKKNKSYIDPTNLDSISFQIKKINKSYRS
jgi:hypothetical protein